MEKQIILANFGGPRSQEEVAAFLCELLLDRDVIQTPFPDLIHRKIFSKVAKKRAPKTAKQYATIGGKSPIFEDTEKMATRLRALLSCQIFPFHRYLRATHKPFLQKIKQTSANQTIVLPLYPQFSFSTTGSIARFFAKHLPKKFCKTLQWIPSYCDHDAFIETYKNHRKHFLEKHHLDPSNICFLYSAHSLPVKYVQKGDPYEKECHKTFAALSSQFTQAEHLLVYQSRVGTKPWLQPYTEDVCENIRAYTDKSTIVFIPLSFTSDHIETLFEIDTLYLPPIIKQKKRAYRLPAINQSKLWETTLATIVHSAKTLPNQALIRNRFLKKSLFL